MKVKKGHIAIIGAGFCGLASAYLLAKKGYRITIYDPAPIGGNASGIAAGLLHCYTGARAKPAKNAEDKLQATLEMLAVASGELGVSVCKKTGLFRPALSKTQESFYRQRAEENPKVKWIEAKEILRQLPEISPFPGIWIADAYQIDTKNYLKGLWKACRALGAEWIRQEILSCKEVQKDMALIATGASPLIETHTLPIHPIKGQILEIDWNIALPFPVSANIYFAPSTSPTRCFAGGTFEHQFQDPGADEERAKQLLLPKIETLFPRLSRIKVVGCRAAVRGSTPERLPLLKQLDEKTWILAGMGSKGLLNHAYYAKKLVEIISRDR